MQLTPEVLNRSPDSEHADAYVKQGVLKMQRRRMTENSDSRYQQLSSIVSPHKHPIQSSPAGTFSDYRRWKYVQTLGVDESPYQTSEIRVTGALRPKSPSSASVEKKIEEVQEALRMRCRLEMQDLMQKHRYDYMSLERRQKARQRVFEQVMPFSTKITQIDWFYEAILSTSICRLERSSLVDFRFQRWNRAKYRKKMYSRTNKKRARVLVERENDDNARK